MADVLAFDVNETLVDLRALDDTFVALFGSASVRSLWFAQMLQLSFVGGLTGEYVDFTVAQRAALRMVAQRQQREMSESDVTSVVEQMRRLPAHADVPDGLRRLRAAGFAMVALTNSVQDVAEDQIANAGIRDCFDSVMSADNVRRLKPAPEPYRAVADAFAVPVGEVRLVAAHWWDVSGALAAGCKAAFITRPGMVLSPIGPTPDVVVANVGALADRLIAPGGQ
ncbi:MAG TPA: haloacid dehalogenase type II [Streptosporangiaceae bacterium]|nr:haloacid dehalogenase type II [Streptosporangiaceae bacterium]